MNESGYDPHRIYVVFANDVHTKVTTQTNSSLDNNISLTQFIHVAMQGAQAWNATSRSQALIYGGTVGSVTSLQAACNATSLRPAVVVWYDQNLSSPANVNNTFCGGSVSSLRIGTGVSIFEMGSDGVTQPNESPRRLVEGIFTHEFGHVVGLADIETTAQCDVQTGTHLDAHSVMNKCANKPGIADGGFFPLSWDKDCVEGAYPARLARNVWQGYDNGGAPEGAHVVDGWTTEKAGVSGGSLRSGSGIIQYLTFQQGLVRSVNAYYDGVLPFSSYFWDIYEEPHLAEHDVRPFPLAAREFAASNEAVRFGFLDDENDSVPSAKNNPPFAEFVVNDPALSHSGPIINQSWKRCANSGCTSTPTVRTHLPFASAWDPITSNTVVAWVETNSANAGDPLGKIWLHPGLTSAGYLKYDPLQALEPAELNLPAESVPFDWTGRTWNHPAIACGDSSYKGSFGYNCILAWTDRGVPSSVGDHVLYKWFRVGSSGQIEFDSTTHQRTGSNTTSAPALGFFGGKMWFAWRATQTFSRVEIFNQATAGSGWTSQGTISSIEGVDAPTFHHHDGRESALLWTISY